MKLKELQELREIMNNHHLYTSEQYIAAKTKLATAEVTGTVFVPVYFGTARHGRGEIDERLVKKHTVMVDGRKAYTSANVASMAGRDRVGMGSCTNFTVCECDPEAVHDCDISVASGPGWRHV